LNPFYNWNNRKIISKIPQNKEYNSSSQLINPERNTEFYQNILCKKTINPYLSPDDTMTDKVFTRVVGNIEKMCHSMPVLLRGSKVDDIAEFGQSSPH